MGVLATVSTQPHNEGPHTKALTRGLGPGSLLRTAYGEPAKQQPDAFGDSWALHTLSFSNLPASPSLLPFNAQVFAHGNTLAAYPASPGPSPPDSSAW